VAGEEIFKGSIKTGALPIQEAASIIMKTTLGNQNFSFAHFINYAMFLIDTTGPITGIFEF
jgi:hypothetical protein